MSRRTDETPDYPPESQTGKRANDARQPADEELDHALRRYAYKRLAANASLKQIAEEVEIAADVLYEVELAEEPEAPKKLLLITGCGVEVSILNSTQLAVWQAILEEF